MGPLDIQKAAGAYAKPGVGSRCQVCGTPLSDASAYRIRFSPPDKSVADAVLCADCFDFMLAPLIQAAGHPRRS